MYTIETEEYKGYKIEIYPDHHASEWMWDEMKDNADGHKDYFTTYGKWGDYDLFDVEGRADTWLMHIQGEYDTGVYVDDYEYSIDGLNEKQEKAITEWIEKNLFVLPVYVYEHSGITMRAGSGFSCPWDSGQAGYIYTDKKRAKEWLGVKRLTKASAQRVYEYMRASIDNYADILEGNVYGYQWEHGGCGGFVGTDTEYMLKEARTEIDAHISEELKQHIQKKKAQIKNHVPLLAR